MDGTNERARNMSPFTLRLVPPEALVAMMQSTATSRNVDLIQSAALGADLNRLANQKATNQNTRVVTGSSGSGLQVLESFVAQGALNNSGTSQFNPALADAYTAADIAMQLQVMQNAEPLVLLINPTEMTISHTKIQSYQSRTRKGYEFEAWGEDQPSISFSGTTAGFVAGVVNQPSSQSGLLRQTDSVSGYQAAARRDSAAWQNFAALYHFYRNNGYIYDTIGKSEAHLFVGSVAIDYDQWTYQGHIENFSIQFDETSPLRVTFSMEFKVSRMYDNARASTVVQPLSTSPQGTNDSVSLSDALSSFTGTQVEQSTTPLDTFVTGGGE